MKPIVPLDARPLLAQGIHPLSMVQEATSKLLPGQSYAILTPFPPLPMIEKIEAAGFEVSCDETEPGLFISTFRKPSE
jgi:hypothetical protein